MKEGPDIALIGSLIGDPARANMLTALMSGKALTATELATEAGVTIQTASSHLKKLEAVNIVQPQKQGRHKYFTLADEEVGSVLEAMMGLAARRGLVRTRTGPKDPALRKARTCYDHLAGEMGVFLYDGLVANGHLTDTSGEVSITQTGQRLVSEFGINLASLNSSNRPLCKSCLDWSARRSHLGGSLGVALLSRFHELGWARRDKASRAVIFSENGERSFREVFA